MCKHLGRAGIVLPPGEYGQLLEHLADVNGWGRGQLMTVMIAAHTEAANAEWRWRNEIEWAQDLSAFLDA